MSTQAGGKAPARAGARVAQRGRQLFAGLTAVASIACGAADTTSTGPELPGQIVLTTRTSGFMQDQSYEVLVDGQVQGTVAADAEFTIPELEPGTYAVALGDVSENCSTEGVSVTVGSGETATTELSVDCAFGAATPYTLRFNRARPNVDTGEITECPFGICSTQEDWDLYVYYSASATPHSIIRQNQTTAVEIAHLPGVTLNELTEADYDGATFTADLVGDSFDTSRVILIRTDLGAVYALGNPVEDTGAQTLTFDAVLLIAQ